MLAFYGWTDNMLLTHCAVKTGSYSTEAADLYVLKLERVTEKVLECIRASGIFENVFILDIPGIRFPKALYLPFKLLSGKRYDRMVRDYYQECGSRKYRLLFTGGLWSYTVFLFSAMKERNPGLEIAITEEGMADYCDRLAFLWLDPISDTRSKLLKHIFYGSRKSQATVDAVRSLYLSRPEFVNFGEQFRKVPLNRSAPKFQELLSAISDNSVPDGYDRPVQFFLQPEPGNERELTSHLFHLLCGEVGEANVLVKTHPNDKSANSIWCDMPDIAADCSGMMFDIIASSRDWDTHVLIARSSSCLLLPLFYRNSHPTLIFLYKLYPPHSLSFVVDSVISILKQEYVDCSRILVPETEEEYMKIISNL